MSWVYTFTKGCLGMETTFNLFYSFFLNQGHEGLVK